ncbi:MAG: FtsX-like permease family protein [Planctomycetota bacterium]
MATGWIRPLRFAVSEQLRHPWRTLLVSQGMIWAVALTLIPAAVIGGTRRDAAERAFELGTNLIQVAADRTLREPLPVLQEDLAPLRDVLPQESVVSGLRVRRAALAEAPAVPGDVWLLGCDENLPGARGKRLLAGRLPASSIPAGTVPGASSEPASVAGIETFDVAIEETLATLLFPAPAAPATEDATTTPARARTDRDWSRALGQTLQLSAPLHPDTAPQGTQLRIVGVIEDEASGGPDPLGGDKEHGTYALAQRLLRALGIAPGAAPWREQGVAIYLPRAAVPGDEVDWLFVRVPPLEVAAASQRIEGFLAGRGRTPLIYTNALWPVLTSPELNGYMTIHTVFFALFLSMGLAVLTNLLLLSGWQRRYEIALRRTEGASRSDIFWQFVWEGMSIAVIGWVLGILAGMLLAHARAALDPFTIMTASWPWLEIAQSGAVLGVGAILASAYPAWRASSYHPMSLFRRS